MRVRRLLSLLLLSAAMALPAFAEWCSGGVSGSWYIECWSSGCTLTVNFSDGEWRAYNVKRDVGDFLCD